MNCKLQRLVRHLYVWTWSVKYQQWDLRFTRFGRSIATVWPNGIWHTWDENGTGGENSECCQAKYMDFENRHFAAKTEAWESCERQGFIIGGALCR